MKKITTVYVALLFLPLVASAQDAQTYLTNFIIFLNNYVIPFLFGMAFLFFAINVIRYFVIGGANQEGQEKAKYLAIYGISAFVFLIIFWGLVNMLTSSLGLDNCNQPVFDYYKQKVAGSWAPPCP